MSRLNNRAGSLAGPGAFPSQCNNDCVCLDSVTIDKEGSEEGQWFVYCHQLALRPLYFLLAQWFKGYYAFSTFESSNLLNGVVM